MDFVPPEQFSTECDDPEQKLEAGKFVKWFQAISLLNAGPGLSVPVASRKIFLKSPSKTLALLTTFFFSGRYYAACPSLSISTCEGSSVELGIFKSIKII